MDSDFPFLDPEDGGVPVRGAQGLIFQSQQQLGNERRVRPLKEHGPNCPSCNSTHTKSCYNNYCSLTQPRYFCKTCRRYWTEGGSLRNVPIGGGSLRNVPIGGGSRKNKRHSSSSSAYSSDTKVNNHHLPSIQQITAKPFQGQDLNLAFPNSGFSEYIGGFSSNMNGAGELSAMELLRTTWIGSMPESASMYGGDGAVPPSGRNMASWEYDNVPVRGAKGPIFEDGPDFDNAFRLFHGQDVVVPEQVSQYNPLAAKAATISLSSFGGGIFGFDSFSNKFKKSKQNKKSSKQEPFSQRGCNSSHEAMSNASLQTGRFLIGKSYAVSSVQPLVAKASQRPPGAKSRRPPATVAARAALARTARAKNFWPQPPHVKMLAVALLAMALNVPLGAWREHTQKYSPQWFAAACAAVPFVGMLAESEAMPKTAMAFNLAASILGQTMGARAERRRLKAQAAEQQTATSTNETGHCREEKAGEPSLPSKGNGSMHPSETSAPAPEGKRVFQNVFNFNLCSPVSQTYF